MPRRLGTFNFAPASDSILRALGKAGELAVGQMIDGTWSGGERRGGEEEEEEGVEGGRGGGVGGERRGWRGYHLTLPLFAATHTMLEPSEVWQSTSQPWLIRYLQRESRDSASCTSGNVAVHCIAAATRMWLAQPQRSYSRQIQARNTS
jgi:hypothetical protein